MPRSTAWKNLEKTTAEILKGIRIHRGGDFSESLPDVIAPLDQTMTKAFPTVGLVAECKYRAKQPWINKYKNLMKGRHKDVKFLVLSLQIVNPITTFDDQFVIMPLANLKDWFDKRADMFQTVSNLKLKLPGYLKDYAEQSIKYISDLDIRDQVQLLYYKAVKDRARPPFETYRSIAVIAQKNDPVRLACFFAKQFDQSF